MMHVPKQPREHGSARVRQSTDHGDTLAFTAMVHSEASGKRTPISIPVRLGVLSFQIQYLVVGNYKFEHE